MVRRPLLLLDIDGVLSPYGAAACPEGYGEYQIFPNDPEPLRLCLDHGRWLMELAEVLDVVWASAWGCVAHEKLGSILGVEQFPFVPMPGIPFPAAEKVPAIDSYVAGRAVAWLDDALGPEAHDWATGREHPTLLISVDPARGLLRSHVEQVLSWARELPAT